MNQIIEKELSLKLQQWWLFSGGLGLNTTIIDANKGSWNLSCGFNDPLTMEALDSDQLFYIYSITKTFSAVMVMKLEESGRITLDAPINHYLEDINLPDSVTVASILNHTSGLGDFCQLEEFHNEMCTNPEKPLDDSWVVENVINNRELMFEPGSDWQYSNTGYMLLRHLVETCSNTSYEECLKQFICQPLGLNNTFYATKERNAQLIKGYSRVFSPNRSMQEVTHRYNPDWVKPGLICSTTQDIARMYHQLFAGNLMSDDTLSKMTRDQKLTGTTKKAGYGYGFDIFSSDTNNVAYGHAGGGPGFTTAVKHFTDNGGGPITIAIFCNTSISVPFHSLFSDFVGVLKDIPGEIN